jgi:predicted NodU family carbamoyl transferase
MKILSFNPGHDGAMAHIVDGRLELSVEAEKDSNYRYSPISAHDVVNFIGALDEVPDAICVGGWWPRDHHESLKDSKLQVGYRGVSKDDIMVSDRRFLKKSIRYFSSTHERSHVLCAFGMSPISRGTPCYALVWEGAIGSFYEIDANSNVTLIADVLNQPGNRYAQLYGLADPTFDKHSYTRFSDAGKLMALASFSKRKTPTVAERKLLEQMLNAPYKKLADHENISEAPFFNVGLDDLEFRNFVGIYSDAIFEIFHSYAKKHLQPNRPLVIAGGCGLNCDWNTKWRETAFFSEVFVPPVANDSGSAIGTAIDAQLFFTGNPKIEWDVYSGLDFQPGGLFNNERYDISDVSYSILADMLANGLIFGWASGRYEIGPRALGNRSILAAPFLDTMRERLNTIKQRESFRPIAPVCLTEDAASWFGCTKESPHMLYTYKAKTEALAAVTHVNGTARIQTVTPTSNLALHGLLTAFKARTGYGVLCNTSLNFNGKGFINNMGDLDAYAFQHGLDGFVVNDKAYLLRSSERYQTWCESCSTSALTRRGT